jgi:hypothetical protein
LEAEMLVPLKIPSGVLAMSQCGSAAGLSTKEHNCMNYRSPTFIFALLLAAALSLTGCASSSRVVNQWTNPEYKGALRLRRILVLGVSKQPSIRRTFEDRFVARLKKEKMDAVQSYLYIQEDGEAAEARLQSAVAQAKADAALIARLVRVEKKTEYSPSAGTGVGLWFLSRLPRRVDWVLRAAAHLSVRCLHLGDEPVRFGKKSVDMERHCADQRPEEYRERN